MLLRPRLAVLVACRSRCARRRGSAASSPPRSANAAGASESSAGDELAGDGPQRACAGRPAGRRRCRAIDASTRGRCIGSSASGSARLTCGRSANASASRAGPRRSGLRHVRRRGAACGARRPSARRRPSGPRTPRRVGPCTSTPFASAMPPSRICARSPSRSVAGARACSRAAAGPGPAVADRGAVERDDRHHLADRRRRERLVGARAARRAANAPSCSSRLELERTNGARDAGQHARAARPACRASSPRRHQTFAVARLEHDARRATSSASSAPARSRLAPRGER